LSREGLVERFKTRLAAEGGTVLEAKDLEGVRPVLAEAAQAEGIQRIMAASDPLVASLGLHAWGKDLGIQVSTPLDYADRDGFKDAVFGADAGVTAADFAVAESGTLVIVHDRCQARLVSLAPPIHIAIVPASRVVPTHESAVGAAFAEGRRPSQVTLITGPSMTADIQATFFRGMHGPKKLIAILVD
jgi:L-lactate dehydrogenase complex protein LldG